MQTPQPENKKLPYKEYPIDPDRELLVWEEWVKIRKEDTTNLGKKTKRAPVDLIMNQLENLRTDKERKIVLEHAQIPKKPSVRGTLWEIPQRLKQHCYCQPVYEVHRTPAELGRPDIIEHVGVPNYILEKEKGLTGVKERNPCTLIDADYEQYRQKREKDLKTKIKKIDPFRPEIDELLVIGSKPKKPPTPKPPLPEIKYISPPSPSQDALCGVYAIRINNTVIYKDIRGQTLPHLQKMQNENWHEFCQSWTYYFNVSAKRVARSKLFLQNLGTVTLRYCWKRIKKPIQYVPDEPFDQIFFFNKNEDVLPPGQSKELSITFISEKPGIFNEYWELSMCNIFFFDTLATKLTINFHGDATEDVIGNNKKIEDNLDDIHITLVYKIVLNLLDDMIKKATLIKPLLYPYKKLFLEAELFVIKNPVCYYHQTEVSKMKEKFNEMSNKEWDLSISSWREVMISKEFDERMAAYDFLKTSHSILLVPWEERDELIKEKYRAVKVMLGQLFGKFYDEFMFISEFYGINREAGDYAVVPSPAIPGERPSKSMEVMCISDPIVQYSISNIFYLRMYEHVANTIELCAGVISSLELNRWLEFDFCR